jgi:uncharacterized protein (DUF2141 family)
MKAVLLISIFSLLLAGCASQPKIADNGKPGQIKVVTFFDENRNGKRDQGEVGISDRVSISQDISCPSSSIQKLIPAETDSNGETVFKDLKPGQYCVAYFGNRGATTRLANLVSLSSDQEIQALIGLSEQ